MIQSILFFLVSVLMDCNQFSEACMSIDVDLTNTKCRPDWYKDKGWYEVSIIAMLNM